MDALEQLWAKGKVGKVTDLLVKRVKHPGPGRHGERAWDRLQLSYCHLVQRQYSQCLELLRGLNGDLSSLALERPAGEAHYCLYLGLCALGLAQWDVALYLALRMATLQSSDAPESLVNEYKAVWHQIIHTVVRWHPESIETVQTLNAQNWSDHWLDPIQGAEAPDQTLTTDPVQVLLAHTQAEARDPETWADGRRVSVAWSLGKYHLAAKYLKRMVGRQTECDATVHFIIGQSHILVREYELAAAAFALCRAMDTPLGLLGQARVHDARDEFEEVLSCLAAWTDTAHPEQRVWPDKLDRLVDLRRPKQVREATRALQARAEEVLAQERQLVLCHSSGCPSASRSRRGHPQGGPIPADTPHVQVYCDRGCRRSFHRPCLDPVPESFQSATCLTPKCDGQVHSVILMPENEDILAPTVIEPDEEEDPDPIPETESPPPEPPVPAPRAQYLPPLPFIPVPAVSNVLVEADPASPETPTVMDILGRNPIVRIDNLVTTSDQLQESLERHLNFVANASLPDDNVTTVPENQTDDRDLSYHLFKCLEQRNTQLKRRQALAFEEQKMLLDMTCVSELCAEVIGESEFRQTVDVARLQGFISGVMAKLEGDIPNFEAIKRNRREELQRAFSLTPTSVPTAVVSNPDDTPNEPPTAKDETEEIMDRIAASFPGLSRAELRETIEESYSPNSSSKESIIADLLELARVDNSSSNIALPSAFLFDTSRAPPPFATQTKSVTPKALKPNECKSRADCSVCLEALGCKNLTKLDACSHTFHSLCIQKWMEKMSNCPNCRKPIVVVEDFPPL